MNITFQIDSQYTKTFDFKNLQNNNILIQRVSILDKGYKDDICLQLDQINNMQEKNQSYLTCINKIYQSDLVNINVPKTRTWRFYLTDRQGNKIKLNHKINVYLNLVLINGK